uniref:Condensin complex subunit 2 n=1 Tax=Vitis vinifera TaxID=29760 RepID=F6HER1_VITVI
MLHHLHRLISPLSTLVSSFEALNVKRFDVAFTVDPLYHQTSAQFDGVKGLLLNNLAVYGGCRVLFDSLEVPGKCILCSSENNSSDMVAISFAKEYIEQMVMNMLEKNEISPTLRDIMCLFNEENQQPSHTFNEAVTDDGFTFGDPTIHSHYEGNDSYTSYEPDVDDRLENVATFLFQGLGFTSKKNVWAGTDHWKFQKCKGSEDVPTESESSFTKKRPKNKKITELDISFTKYLVKEAPDVFVPLKNPKLLLLPASREPCRNTLPEDCHYQPEDLVKLFLLPKVMCLGKRRRQLPDAQEHNDDDRLPSWDNGSVFNCQYDDGYADSDVENLDILVSQPRQVKKIEVQYDKTSKQIDVHILKKTLQDLMQESIQMSEAVYNNAISLKHILSTFPDDCPAAKLQDISPHLCFICLLHLVNEHCLNMHGCPNLDDLIMQFPLSSQNTGDVILSSS